MLTCSQPEKFRLVELVFVELANVKTTVDRLRTLAQLSYNDCSIIRLEFANFDGSTLTIV